MVRTWGFVTLTGSAQPVFATTLASAFTPKTDGNGVPLRGQTLSLTLGTNFLKGDRLCIVEAGGTLMEFTHIATISGNTITADMKYAHAAGAWVILDESYTAAYVQTGFSNAGKVGIGTGLNTALTGGAGNQLIMVLAIPTGGQSPEFSSANNYGADPKHSAELWAIGTLNDLILPSFEAT